MGAVRIRLATITSRFDYRDGEWTFRRYRFGLINGDVSRGSVISGSEMEIVPIGRILTVGLRVQLPTTGELIEIFPIRRGDQSKAMRVVADWNIKSNRSR